MRTLLITITMLISAINISLMAQVPVDAQHPYAEIHYSSTPQDNRWGIAWFQSATIQNDGVANNGYIVVDHIKLIEENPSTGQETVLHVENYNGSGQLSQSEGGLFVRFPSWYFNDNNTPLVNSNKSGGFVTINVGEKPNNIIHFWGVRRQCTIGRRHKVEIRLKIVGEIGFQLGMDYWSNSTTTDPANIKEAFYSPWYGDTGGEFITIKYPDYNAIPEFDRSDYGFTQNGKFYLSKRLVDHVGATSVALMHNSTGWEPVNMTLNGDFYEYHAYSNYYGFETYCFKANPSGNSFFIPHAVIDKLKYPEDAIPNGYGGYNFYTAPVAQLSAPANLAATYQTEANTIVLNWNYVPNATQYKVFWSNSPGVNSSSNVLITTTTTQFTLTDVNIGLCYYFKVQAINAHSQSSLSSEAHACAESNVPATPENLSVAYNSSQTANFLTWDPAEGATEYRLYWGTSSGVTNSSNLLVTSNTEFIHSGMVVGSCYYYRISAANNDGESDLSPEVFACAETNIPETPQNFSVIYQPNENSNLLSWDTVNEATQYRVYWGNEPGVSVEDSYIIVDSNHYIHIINSPGSYYYRISATNSFGESPLTNELCITINLTTPKNLQISVLHETLYLTWDPVPMASEYKIYYSHSPNTNENSTVAGQPTTNLFDFGQVYPANSYYFRVSAISGTFESELSEQVNHTYFLQPPTGLSASYCSESNSNTLTWSNAFNASSYKVFYNTVTGINNTFTFLAETTDTTIVHNNLQPNQCYYYRVQSYSNNHQQDWYSDYSSEVVSCVPNVDGDDELVFDRSDYGVYRDGKYFLSKRLVDFVSGNQVAVMSNSTGWQPINMVLIGERFEVKIDGVYYDSKHLYCFKINNQFYVPHAVLDKLKFPEDAIENNQGGYNFYTDPISPVSSFQLSNYNRIKIFPNPTSEFITIDIDNYKTDYLEVAIIDGLGKKEIFIIDCLPAKINLSRFKKGLYIVSVRSRESQLFTTIILIN